MTDHLTLVGEQALRDLVIERDKLRAHLARAHELVEEARREARMAGAWSSLLSEALVELEQALSKDREALRKIRGMEGA